LAGDGFSAGFPVSPIGTIRAAFLKRGGCNEDRESVGSRPEMRIRNAATIVLSLLSLWCAVNRLNAAQDPQDFERKLSIVTEKANLPVQNIWSFPDISIIDRMSIQSDPLLGGVLWTNEVIRA